MPLQPTITLCMIAAECDAPQLARAIASARDQVDQVVVVVDPASVEARRVAEEAGAEVHDFTWCGDFAAARNAALHHAHGTWILILDADEVLDAMAPGQLREALALVQRPAVFNVCVTSEVSPGRCVKNETSRIFPRRVRDGRPVLYKGVIHEAPIDPSGELPHLSFPLVSITHDGYTPEAIERAGKGERNVAILADAIAGDPDNPQLRLYMAQSLHVAGFDRDAADQCRLAVYLTRFSGLDVADSCHDQAAADLLSILCAAGAHEQAVAEGQAIAQYRQPAHPGFWCNLATAYRATAAHPLAASAAYTALACRHATTQQVDEGAVTWMPDGVLGLALCGMGRAAEAAVHLRAALAYPSCGNREAFEAQLVHLERHFLGVPTAA